MPAETEFDVVSIGRAGLDLYARELSAHFENVRSFSAYVGGTPANIAVGARRLGLRTALLTAVSSDPVGDFILHFLRAEGVDVRCVSRKFHGKSGLVLLAIFPNGESERVHYRDTCADEQLTIDDVAAFPMESCRRLVVAGSNLTRSPGRDATFFAAERAHALGIDIVLDLDYREDFWSEPRVYAQAVRSLLPFCRTIIGTTDEIHAAALDERGIEDTKDTRTCIEVLFGGGGRVVVEKCGAAGARVHFMEGDAIDVPPFDVQLQNSLGAGDAFAAGLLFGRNNDWDWYRAVRFANACGAIVAGRHACSADSPFENEVESFIEERGGF